MRRLIVLGAVTLALAGVAAAPGGAATGDVKGPKCADVIFGDVGYFVDGAGGPGFFTAQLLMNAPACSYVTYTFYLLAGSTWIPVAGTIDPSGAVNFSYQFAAPAPNPICAYATASIGGHVFDYAPDGGAPNCNELDGLSGSGGSGGWN